MKNLSMKSWIGTAGLTALFALTGCGDGGKDAAVDEPDDVEEAAAAKKEDPSGPAGMIKGKTTYQGTPTPRTVIDMRKDANCVKKHTTPVTEEWFLGGEGNMLGNVIVEIVSGPKLWKAKPGDVSKTPFVLDQSGCQYLPHVWALRAGTPFEVKNSDDTDHNVHFYGVVNKTGSKDNVPHAKGGANIAWKLDKPEDGLVPFKCDVHPWMSSYGRVVDHNWFSVTTKAGSFEFNELPPGDYKVVAWHEQFEKPLSKKLTIPPGGSVEHAFVFKF